MGEPISFLKIKGWLVKQSGPLSTGQKVVAAVIIIVFLFAFYVVLDANKYRAQVRVIESEGVVGINPTARALDFGDLSRGTSAIRRIVIENKTAMPIYVMIFKVGDISDLMKINKNYFKLRPNEATKIEFTTYIPASAESNRVYKGKVYLFKIPTFWL
ncbi:MAG: hypothetical protein ACK4NX_00935 [Candidatus Paceibacteria bacterium]